MEGGDYAPHCVVAHDAAKREGGGHVGEGRVGRTHSKGVDCCKATCVTQGSLHLLIEVVHLQIKVRKELWKDQISPPLEQLQQQQRQHLP